MLKPSIMKIVLFIMLVISTIGKPCFTNELQVAARLMWDVSQSVSKLLRYEILRVGSSHAVAWSWLGWQVGIALSISICKGILLYASFEVHVDWHCHRVAWSHCIGGWWMKITILDRCNDSSDHYLSDHYLISPYHSHRNNLILSFSLNQTLMD